jgi:CDP-6-deoxy-D-xylo-4-hexulose-3-dehydrase
MTSNFPLASSTWDDEEIAAILEVIESGRFTMGSQVASFESEFASEIGSKFAVMVNSGSSANLAMVAASRYRHESLLPAGSEVIVPAVSWSTTYYPITQLGGRLKFVDVDKNTLNIEVASIEAAITKNTKAIFGVNLLGNPANWGEIRKIADEHNLLLLEDNCESLGSSLDGINSGANGFAGTFSSYFSHHISTIEGGMIVTDDESLFQTLKSIRAHGWTRDLPDDNFVFKKTGAPWDDLFRFVLPGYNLRPIEFEAAIGRIQLRKLENFVSVRRKNAEIFRSLTSELKSYTFQQEHGKSSWFGFSIILEDKLMNKREKLLTLLQSAGIETRPIVAGNFTRNPVIHHLEHAEIGDLPNSDLVHDQGFFVGNHHFDIKEKLEKLVQILDDFERCN